MLLSEAIDFLKNVLKIDQVESKVESSKLELLKEICEKFQQHIPFQNLSLLATEPTERCLPTTDDIRSAYFSKIGGLCYTTACFCKQLLLALGYDVELIACSVYRIGAPCSHVACIVKGLAPNERYLVDVGAGFPTFEAVPLHSLPQIYKHAFQEYKFICQPDGKIARLNKFGANSLGNLPTTAEDGWQKFYDFEDVYRDNDFFKPYHTPIYTEPGYGSGWFLMGLKISYYPKNEAYTINDYVLKKWKKGEEVQTVNLQDENELQQAVKNYFPTLNNIDVHKAVLNWNENKMNFKSK